MKNEEKTQQPDLVSDDEKKLKHENKKEKKEEKKEEKEGKEGIGLERARIAVEKMQLAWIRTSITISALGFTAYKIFEEEAGSSKVSMLGFVPVQTHGLFMLFIGLVALLVATIQHVKTLAKIRKQYELYGKMPRSMSLLLSYAILSFTFFMFFGTILNYLMK